MKIYRVLQGNFTASGCGDYFEQGRFYNLETAKMCMDSIYDDTKGYSRYPYGYLETVIEEYDDQYEDDYYCPEWIESKRYYY